MCTVTWNLHGGGYELLCNRDERFTRADAVPPKVQMHDDVRYIAPTDGDFGGTWIASNEFGVTLCLLNGADGTEKKETVRAGLSRGLLIPMLIASAGTGRVCDRINHIDLPAFAPFTLAILSPGEAVMQVEWDGRRRTIGPARTSLLSSSSFETGSVQATRRDEFARCLKRGKSVFDFHSSHSPRGGAYSVCMHRDDAETVSFSWVRVSGNEVSFFYAPGAPCRWMPGERQILELRQAA